MSYIHILKINLISRVIQFNTSCPFPYKISHDHLKQGFSFKDSQALCCCCCVCVFICLFACLFVCSFVLFCFDLLGAGGIHRRYRKILMWEDNTIDYHFAYYASLSTRPVCGSIVLSSFSLTYIGCNWAKSISRYLCQKPDGQNQQQHFEEGSSNANNIRGFPPQWLSPPARHWPVLSPVRVNVTSQHRGSWNPVVCPDSHVTHTFLACDVSASCWAKSDVTFSPRPESWALPTSQTCRVPLTMTLLPPSFPCRSDEQRVSYSMVCDHRRDCPDGGDETFCKFQPCQPLSQFQCLNEQVYLSLLPVNVHKQFS